MGAEAPRVEMTMPDAVETTDRRALADATYVSLRLWGARCEVRLADAGRHVDASPRRRPRATGDPRDRARRIGRLIALPHESIVTASELMKSGLSRPTAVPTRTESRTWSVTWN